MIRVLQVFGWPDRGGAETMVMNYYRNIDRTKIQFDFVKHTERRCAYDDEIESLGGRIFSIPRFKGYNLIGFHRAWVNFLREHPEWHTIHIHQFTLGSQIAFAAKCAGVKNRIIHVHSVGWKAPLYTFLGIHSRLNVAGFARTANHLLACGQLSGEFFYGKRPFTIQPNAIDVEKFKPNDKIRTAFRHKCGFDPDSLVLVHVGRFIAEKNHLFILEILSVLLKNNIKARLLLVGDGDARQATEKRAIELGLNDKVVFAGLQSDVYNWLQAGDVFVLPSLVEGLPVCIVEAQASGLPCVMSDHLDKSVNISGQVYFESIKSHAERWGQLIKNIKTRNKNQIHNSIELSQYNIHNAKNWLEEFYLSIQ